VNTNEAKSSFMSAEAMGTNTASREAVDAAVATSVVAMSLWLKNGTVPADYMRKVLGDPAQGVTVHPAPLPAQQPNNP
jgi:hypothetical protein